MTHKSGAAYRIGALCIARFLAEYVSSCSVGPGVRHHRMHAALVLLAAKRVGRSKVSRIVSDQRKLRRIQVARNRVSEELEIWDWTQLNS